MPDILKKIITLIVSEVVEGIFFGVCLYVTLLFPDDTVRTSVITSILLLWAIAGIGTPIIIFTDLKEMLSDIFNGNSGRN
jgi:hypothetical protein